MAARVFLVLVVIGVFIQTMASAEDMTASSGIEITTPAKSSSLAEAIENETVEPWIHEAMDPAIRTKLESGLEIAVERVREVESCNDLFEELGADALATLHASRYLQVDTHLREVQICGRDGATRFQGAKNLAFTRVGGAWTWICRHFARVSDEEAAVAVIHESLHKAGLPEWPLDRTAMTSPQITKMVKKKCQL
jgi:hypothetical protein